MSNGDEASKQAEEEVEPVIPAQEEQAGAPLEASQPQEESSPSEEPDQEEKAEEAAPEEKAEERDEEENPEEAAPEEKSEVPDSEENSEATGEEEGSTDEADIPAEADASLSQEEVAEELLSSGERLPEIKEILCAMLFATKEPLTIRQMVNVFRRTAETYEGPAAQFMEISSKELAPALEELQRDLLKQRLGLEIAEVAGGFRLRNSTLVGPWLRELLEKGKSNKLSKPALETLSIIAYRQPIQRSEMESIRGVAVDSIVRSLLEMGLIKVVGRSELPGRPWLYGTTQSFLEHFGLKNLDELPGMTEMRRHLQQQEMKLEKEAEAQAAAEAAAESSSEED